MTDYTDLIAALHKCGLANGTALGGHSDLADEAADAIKQLVRERDALLCALRGNCLECKHYNDDFISSFCNECNCYHGWNDKWEWRGLDV